MNMKICAFEAAFQANSGEIVYNSLQLSASEVIVVGDDITSDIVGAETMKMRSILVQTGKFKPNQLEDPVAKPTWVLEGVWGLTQLF